MDSEVEAWRLECEAREWLKRLDRDPKRIREKLAVIAKNRGQQVADRLAEAMRREYVKGAR